MPLVVEGVSADKHDRAGRTTGLELFERSYETVTVSVTVTPKIAKTVDSSVLIGES